MGFSGGNFATCYCYFLPLGGFTPRNAITTLGSCVGRTKHRKVAHGTTR